MYNYQGAGSVYVWILALLSALLKDVLDYQVLLRRWPQLIRPIDQLVHVGDHLWRLNNKIVI